MAPYEEVFFRSCDYVRSDGNLYGFRAVASNWFEYIQRETLKQIMCSENQMCITRRKQATEGEMLLILYTSTRTRQRAQ